ncbi:MAG: hypothetical protein R3B13_29750 [Polyangiaceae bacterium]
MRRRESRDTSGHVTLVRLGLLLLALMLPVFGGCVDLGSDDAKLPATIPGDWPMERPSRTRFEPGAQLTVLTRNIDIPLTDIVFYIEDVALVRPRARVVEEGDDPNSNVDDVIELSIYLPLARAGSYLVGFGSEDSRRTGQLPLTVFVPNRRMPRAESAAALESGVQRLAEVVGATWLDEDPKYREFLQQTLGDPGIADLAALTDASKAIATLARQNYDALSDEDERAMQALLYNTRMTWFLRDLVSDIPVSADIEGSLGTSQQAVITLADRLPHPVHRVLYSLDFMAMGLHVAGDALDIINLAAALTGGAGLAVSAPITVAMGLMKFAIDSFFPTDLFELEAHDQRRLYDNRRAKWVYWGTFRPQSGLSSIVGATVEGALSALLEALIDKGALGDRVALLWKRLGKNSKAAEQFLSEVSQNLVTLLQKIGSAVPGKGVDSLLQSFAGSTDALNEVKLRVNMIAYTYTVGDMLTLVPVFGPALKSTTWLLDFEISSPLEVDSSSAPEFMKQVSAGLFYADDEIGVSGPASFPPGVKEGPLTLISNAYRWQQKTFGVFNRPGYESVSIAHGIVVEDGDIMTFRDDSLILIDTPDGSLVVTKGTSKERPVEVTLSNLVGGDVSLVPTVTVLVNGAPQIDNLQLPPLGQPTPPITLMLAPGKNELTLIGVEAGDPAASLYTAATALSFPKAINKTPEKRIYIAAGEQQSFRVFTPPAVP